MYFLISKDQLFKFFVTAITDILIDWHLITLSKEFMRHTKQHFKTDPACFIKVFLL